eukprot:TRINITY_DN10613_c0_g1_i1.p1 TRINITY_DN10613_c0_g1~~TRINITY_DN10613_c0_g1_i1.p1  ORF type:complete len:144 (+),score=7.21 TRINITY_DN10613_c0_g1_i1:95-526(+)
MKRVGRGSNSKSYIRMTRGSSAPPDSADLALPFLFGGLARRPCFSGSRTELCFDTLELPLGLFGTIPPNEACFDTIGLFLGLFGGLARRPCCTPSPIELCFDPRGVPLGESTRDSICLLYTSDAADEEDSVDLGGRRIIKKKK